jgi:hypothetical protein
MTVPGGVINPGLPLRFYVREIYVRESRLRL